MEHAQIANAKDQADHREENKGEDRNQRTGQQRGSEARRSESGWYQRALITVQARSECREDQTPESNEQHDHRRNCEAEFLFLSGCGARVHFEWVDWKKFTMSGAC